MIYLSCNLSNQWKLCQMKRYPMLYKSGHSNEWNKYILTRPKEDIQMGILMVKKK